MSLTKRQIITAIITGLAFTAVPALPFAADLFPGYGAAISSASADADGYIPQLLVSTPGYPVNGAYIRVSRPGFAWVGLSTSAAANLWGARYVLQVDNNSDFSSPEVALSTQVIVNSTSVVSADSAITLSTHTLPEATTWYWRVFTQGSGLSGPYSPAFSFVTDFTPPAVSGFQARSSSGVWFGEGQWMGLSGGVTVQATVQDSMTGLAVSTGALAFAGDGHDDPGAAGGYGVMYSTNAGLSWVDWSTYTAALSGTGEGYIRSLSVFNGKLYAGTGSNGKIYSSADGTTWTPVLSGIGENYIYSLSVFNGKLYAGTYPSGKIYSSADGTGWTPVLSGTGEAQILSLSVFNGKLYAGTWPNGKIYSSADGLNWALVMSGSGENGINSLSVFNSRLYAGTYPGGKIYSSADGTGWAPVLSGTGEDFIYSLAVFNGKLYAGTGSTGKIYSSADGANWTPVLSGVGASQILSLSAFNGKLYAGTAPNGRIYSSVDGVGWTPVLTGAGEDQILSLSAFNGKLYAGSGAGGKVFQFSPVTAALTGNDGTAAAQTLTASGLNLVTSTNAQTCNGSACGATNQVVFSASDLAGNVKTYGPYAVWVDTTLPLVSLQSFSVSSLTLSAAASGEDLPSGIKDYFFEISPAADFSAGVSSAGYGVSSAAVFPGLLEATTYYARARGRDNALNTGNWSVVLATQTRGFVYVSSQSLAPAEAMQGTDAVMLSLNMAANAGKSAVLQRIDLARTGTASASDIAAVKIYRDINGDGILDGGDAMYGAAAFSGANASVGISPPLVLTDTPAKVLVVYSFAAGATVGKTAGVAIDSASKLVFADPYLPVGVFPLNSSLTALLDGVNTLNIIPSSIAPGIAPPGLANVPVIKLAMNTNTGTSLINSLNVRLAGTVLSGNVSAVKLYLDANSNAQFDLLGDQLLSSGSDAFMNYSSTVALTAAAGSRTVGTATRYMFVVVDVAADAPEGANFTLAIPTATAFVLNNPGDTPALATATFASSQVTVQTSNSAYVHLQSLAPAEFWQGGLYAVAKATLTVNMGIAELNRVKLNRAGTSTDSDIRSVRVYQDQEQDGGDFNQYFDLLLGSSVFSGSVATIDIATVTVAAGATAQLFIVYEISPTAAASNMTGAGFTNSGYFRMSSLFTSVSGNFPYNTPTAPIRATINPVRVEAAVDITTGELFQGTTNNAVLRLDLRSELNPVNWTSLHVKKTGTVPDNMIDAVKLYLDANSDGVATPGTDTLVTAGNDIFVSGEVNLSFSVPQSVTAGGGAYLLTLDMNAGAEHGTTAGVEVSTADFALDSPNYISSSSVPGPYTGGPVLVTQYPNIVTVSTANIMPAAGAYPGTNDVPVFKLRLETNISKARFVSVRLTKSGTLADSEIKAVKVYHDVNNLGSFNSSRPGDYALVTPATATFGADGQQGMITLWISTAAPEIIKTGRTYFVAVDLQPTAVIGHSMTMRAQDSSYFAVSAPNTVAPVNFASPLLYVRAPPQVMGAAFESRLSTYVVQGQNSVLVASFTLTASSFSIDMSRIDFLRGGSGGDGDLAAIKLYRDNNNNGSWDGIGTETRLADGVVSGGVISFTPENMQTIQCPNAYVYYVVADISPNASSGRTFGVDVPAVGYITVNAPHTVSAGGLPFASARAVIQATVDNMTAAGEDRAPALTQADSGKVMGRLRVYTGSNSAMMSSIRFEKAGTTPDADIARIRVYKDDGDLALGAGDALAGTLNALSSGVGVMVISPEQAVGITPVDYLVTVDLSTLAAINTSFNLRVTPAVVAPDIVSITGSTITFTMAGTIADKPDTVYMGFSDIASRSLYIGVSSNALAKISFRADNDTAYLTGLKLDFIGSAGPSDVPRVKLYRDTDGNGYFDPAYDVLAATASIVSGEAGLYLPGDGDAVTSSTRTYFAAADIAAAAEIGGTLSLNIANENSVYLAGADSAYPFSGQNTEVSTVRDPRIPMPPAISVYKADGSLYPDISEAFNAYRTLLRFRWQSEALQGSVERAEYYIGAQPANESTPAGSWIVAGSNREISIRGLNLLNNGIYYLSVRVKNSEGAYYSDITARRFIVDTVVPAIPAGAVSLATEGSDLVINWDPASVGVSGIEYYVVEERRGNNPLWVVISTTSDCFLPINSGSRPSEISRGAGSYFYRIYPVNKAGMPGPASEPLAVNIGLEQLAGISDASFYPNPFDSRKQGGKVAFTLNRDIEVSITIYDAFGQKVKSFGLAGVAGPNSLAWDGTGPSGKVSMGMYLCVIKAAGDSKVLRIGVKH